MNESTFTRQYMRNLIRQLNAVYFKIRDPRLAMGMGHLTGTRFVDVVCCVDGIFVALEWKLSIINRGFRIEKVRESQLTALEAVQAAGGVGLLMFGEYNSATDKIVYVVQPAQWRAAVQNTTKKSLLVSDVFSNCATRMQRSGSFKNWDLSPILNEINRIKRKVNNNAG